MWTKEDYPAGFKNLKKDIRNKAIDIANAMLREGEPASKAIPIAISSAKKMYRQDEKKTYHLVPYDGHWILKDSTKENDLKKFDTKESAISQAERIASENHAHIVVHRRDGTIQKHIS
ncbi:MAG: DUF2188 domain-containing protein [Candidatus Kapaibacterium sp.]